MAMDSPFGAGSGADGTATWQIEAILLLDEPAKASA